VKEIYAVLPEVLDPTSARVVVELGAHQGEDTLQLRRLFPNAELYSFEPDPRNVEAMRRNGSAAATTLVEAAVSDRDGFATFHLSSAALDEAPSWVRDAEYSGSSSLKPPGAVADVHPWLRFDRAVTVATLSLDSFVRERSIRWIDFVWADVQGAEDLMLAGGTTALSRTELLYTECAESGEYEGELGVEEIVDRLPGSWEVVRRFPFDVLLRNVT
jgi:FkbM family methyltransferase